MKLNLTGLPSVAEAQGHRVGNIYRTSHGTFHLIVGFADQRGSRVHVVTFNEAGESRATQVYGTPYLDHIVKVGHVDLTLSPTWEVKS